MSSPIVVVSHVLDEAAEVYRLTVGAAVVVERDGEPETVYVDREDFLFAADDPRWHTEDGERLPLGEVAAVQRGDVREALEQRAAAAEAAIAGESHELPGVGDVL